MADFRFRCVKILGNHIGTRELNHIGLGSRASKHTGRQRQWNAFTDGAVNALIWRRRIIYM